MSAHGALGRGRRGLPHSAVSACDLWSGGHDAHDVVGLHVRARADTLKKRRRPPAERTDRQTGWTQPMSPLTMRTLIMQRRRNSNEAVWRRIISGFRSNETMAVREWEIRLGYSSQFCDVDKVTKRLTLQHRPEMERRGNVLTRLEKKTRDIIQCAFIFLPITVQNKG